MSIAIAKTNEVSVIIQIRRHTVNRILSSHRDIMLMMRRELYKLISVDTDINGRTATTHTVFYTAFLHSVLTQPIGNDAKKMKSRQNPVVFIVIMGILK